MNNNESFICECGEDTFLWFTDHIKCNKCSNKYFYDHQTEELWLCRFNKETCGYGNWEHSKLIYKDIIRGMSNEN